jgi:hypothetical protein
MGNGPWRLPHEANRLAVVPDLTGVDLKLRRADTHLEDLDHSVTAFLNDVNAKPLLLELDRETGHHAYCVQYLPPTPTDWPLIAGEILFHLRSALDHLAWQLVLLDKRTPTKYTKFPIKKMPCYKKNGRLVPVNLNPPVKNRKIVKALNECQPCIGPDGQPLRPRGDITPDYVKRHPLHELQVLNNIDKHRLLLVVAHAIDIYRPMYWDYRRGLKPRLNLEPLKAGSPVAWFDFGGADPPPDFNPRVSLEVVINTAELPHLINVPLTKVLYRIAQSVNMDVLNRHFLRLFA